MGCGISFHTNFGRSITDFIGTEYDASTEIIPGDQCGAEQTFAASSDQAVVSLETITAPVNSEGKRKVSVSRVVEEPINYVCVDCASGTYKTVTGTGSCTTCPPKSSTSGVGSSSLDDCTCNAGYTPDVVTGECTACPVGTYKAAPPSRSACTSCGTGRTTTDVARISALECTCAEGYGGANCVLCEAGKYKPLIGNQECYQCVPGRTSPPGSSAQSACTCKPGYTSVTGVATCQDCPVKIKSFHAQYLYRVIFESQSDPDGVGGAGGTWHEYDINHGEYILSMSYQPFIADWQTYLGCRYLHTF